MVCAIVITSTTFLLASKRAVIVLKSEMLTQNSSTSRWEVVSTWCAAKLNHHLGTMLCQHADSLDFWLQTWCHSVSPNLNSFTQPEPSPVRARPKLKARTCSTCQQSPAIDEDAGSSGELRIRMAPVALSELRLKWTGMDLDLRTRAIDPFWYFCESHPSFSNLPIQIKGEVTTAIITRSRKTTWPNCTSAILAPFDVDWFTLRINEVWTIKNFVRMSYCSKPQSENWSISSKVQNHLHIAGTWKSNSSDAVRVTEIWNQHITGLMQRETLASITTCPQTIIITACHVGMLTNRSILSVVSHATVQVRFYRNISWESETILQYPDESYILKSRTSTLLSKSSSKSPMIGPEMSW